MKDNYTELAIEFKETGSHVTFTKLYKKMTPGLKHFIKGYVKDLDVHNLNVCKVYVNRSKFCFDGYLVSSDYVGSF